MTAPKKGVVNFLQEFSIPLIVGAVAAMVAANVAPHWYSYSFGSGHDGDVWHVPGLAIFGHPVTSRFLINELFMVFFFGIAAKEITEACLPGGSLNPPRKAVNPLLATLGGVLGPVLAFFGALALFRGAGAFEGFSDERLASLHRGWGIPTATDIALAWLVARAVFGRGHPAINFLLLLAVADDAIGLAIIAVFYGDPLSPTEPAWLLLVLGAMALAVGMRRMRVRSWLPYVGLAGPLAWSGLVLAHLHGALALVFVVPFLPGPRRDTGMFVDEDEVDVMGADTAHDLALEHSPLHSFEHDLKLFVDLGLFFFAFCNAGVQLAELGPMTWIVLGSLVVGKTVGITLLGLVANACGFPLPNRMGLRELVMAGFVASLGMTVALFVAGAAFAQDPVLEGQAKMGALFSGFVGLVAIALGRVLGMGSAAQGAPAATPPARAADEVAHAVAPSPPAPFGERHPSSASRREGL